MLTVEDDRRYFTWYFSFSFGRFMLHSSGHGFGQSQSIRIIQKRIKSINNNSRIIHGQLLSSRWDSRAFSGLRSVFFFNMQRGCKVQSIDSENGSVVTFCQADDRSTLRVYDYDRKVRNFENGVSRKHSWKHFGWNCSRRTRRSHYFKCVIYFNQIC